MSETSRDHVDRFERRERQDIEALRAAIGAEAVARMDRIVLRDLIARRKEKALDALLGVEGGTETPKHRVMVSLRSGKTPKARVPLRTDRRTRRRLVIQRRQFGERAVAGLAESLAVRGVGIEEKFWLTHSVVALVDDEQLADLAAREDVASIAHTKKQIILALDVSRGLIGADAVASGGVTGADIDVAVLDTGIDTTHPDLAGVIGSQQDFTGEGMGDLHGHGTHCAGVVASQHATFRGIAPGAIVHDYKLMDQNGAANSAVCVAAIQQAVADGMAVLSNSWGFTHRNGNWTDADGTCVLCAAADAAMNAGSVFVVAAGNEGNDSCGTYDTKIRCPGIAELPICVGASDDNDTMAGFSSPGPTPDGRDKPDVTAPGVDIVAARSSTGSDMGGGATVIDPTHVQASGTSMACPHVAGVAALMLDQNGTLTPADIKAVLMATAVDLGAPTEEQGAGRVDARSAVASV